MQSVKSKKTKAKGEIGFLNPSLLNIEVAIEDALSVLGGRLDNLSVNAEHVLSALLSIPHLLEFALSGLDDATFHLLEAWLVENFPSRASDYASSISSSILAQLSLSLLFVSYPSSAEEQATLKAHRRVVEYAPAVFAVLSGDVFDDANAPDGVADSADRPAKRKTQRERKQRKRCNIVVDAKPFEAIGISAPSSRTEAGELAEKILNGQKIILQYYLQILRRPDLKETFKSTYLPEPSAQVDDGADSRAYPEPAPPLDSGIETLHAAYPMVQPMKAALYFDSADGFGEWRVLISTRADADLRQTRKREFKLFEIIIKKIKELSTGHFSDDNHKRLTGPETDIPIYEAKMTRDSRLVYQIDCVAEFESHVERQVIKIFGIYTHAQLDKRFWSGVGHQLARRGKEYHDRCTHRKRPQVAGDKVYLPESWPALAEDDSSTWTSGIPDLHKDDLAKMHELLVLEKYVTFSQALLNSVLADKDVQHVFDISKHEMRIIEHPGSCYVIGRSGTGKTTTMMFKMLGIERSAQSCSDTLPKPRQLFVTQSRILAEKVEQFFTKLMGALNTSNLSPEELEQIKVTGRMKAEQGLVDLDEEIAHRGDLPKRFSELTDDHFPMFATFDQICSLLEADLTTRYSEQLNPSLDPLNDSDSTNGGPHRSTDYMQQRRVAFISYDVFFKKYWSHFPESLTKGLDPTLVFGEFMGVIKGSEQTLEHEARYLPRKTYINFSYRQQATFMGKREIIYSLFEIYSKKKREHDEYDVADRTHAILKRLHNGDLPGKQVDFIYIDEAQDNLLIDALILRTMCNNPASGLFWAGDTAQTISVGSAFRFNDLKAFLYRIETRGLQSASRILQPQSFQLVVNYRSHAGIVNCAHSIIELITKFWPNAIDTLAQEKGMIDGLKPVFFSGWDQDTVRYEQFLFGESGNQIEFGAEQCILVRDDAAREQLRAQVGDIGIILTLYESKGLEFNDVLLYNFFEDSAADVSQWRVVLNALSEDIGIKTPRFDEVRHSSVCRELKFLYVACTRARMNLWIADGSDKAEPMRLFWTRRALVQNCTPGADVPRLAVSSTPEQWAATARALFHRRRYTQAMHCYERASLPREKAVAHAYWLREQARSSPVHSRRGGTSQSKAFATAADAFWESADEAVTEKLTYFRLSAECYASSGDDVKAAEVYYRACEFDLAAQLYRKAGMFDEAITVVRSHRETMDEVVAKNIVDVSKLFYLRDHKLREARDLFESDEETLEYMDDYGFDVTRASYLEELGRLADAAEVHLAEGRTLEAIELFSRDSQDARSSFRASRCLLDGLWSYVSFGIKPNPDPESWSDILRGLLRLLPALNVANLDGRTRDEVLMFRAIVSGDFTVLSDLGERFYHQHQDPAAALMCLDHVCTNMPNLRGASAPEVARTLQSFLLYVRILQNLSADPHPCSNEAVRRLFGFEPTTEESFLVPKATWLYTQCDDFSPMRRDDGRGTVILRWDLDNRIGRLLRSRLREQVSKENSLCREIQVLQPCLPFVVFNRCTRISCPREHADSTSLNVHTYNLRVRIAILQILIYHYVFAVEDYWEQVRQQRYWIRQFYEALYPAFYKLGSIHNLSFKVIPELQEGIHVLNTWTRDQLVSLKPDANGEISKLFLTLLIRTASLSFDFDFKFAHNHIPSIRAVSAYRPEHLIREKDKAYVIHYILAFMEDTHRSSLSSAVLFVCHVLENRLHVDIGVFCDVLDRLCGMLIVSHRNFRKEIPTFHDITLPCSWLMRLSQDFKRLPSKDSNLAFLYVRPMADVLEQMISCVNADHLLFESKDLGYLGWKYSSVFIHRICRNLCLLGYNIRNDMLRRSIWTAITSIRGPDRRYNALFSDYVHARNWDDLSRIVRRSTSGSSLDEMIQLHDANRTSSGWSSLPYVRRVVYKTLDEIPALLRSTASISGPEGDTAPGALPVPPPMDATSTVLSIREDPVPEEQLPEQEELEEVGDDAMQHIQDIEGVAVTIEKPRTRSAESTQEEFRAARTILAAYRKYIRRRGFVMSRAHGMRVRLQAACYSASQDIEWPRKFLYRKLFLGAVPHLLVCLEYTREHLHAARAKARKRVKLVEHSEFEKVNAKIDRLTALFKTAIQLEKDLGPLSELHKRREVNQLREYAQQVKDLVQAQPSGARMEWEEDFGLAMHAIIKAKAVVAAKTLKPELNIEEDLDLDVY